MKANAALNPLVSLYYLFVGRGGRKRGNRQTDGPSSVTLAAHARQGLITLCTLSEIFCAASLQVP